jgi:hypothetical protein
MVARVAAASKYREKCKKPEKPILVGGPLESPTPLCATVQIREFLGAAAFCQICIPNYALLENYFMKPQKGESRNSWYGERYKKGL